MKWIDIPPVWLFLALAMAWGIAEVQPLWLAWDGALPDFLGGLLVGGGVLLMVLAMVEMQKWRTTVIPHREARHLVTSGIFRRSRNPIYLGDALLLAGLALYWGAPVALLLVPLFAYTIAVRFIEAEEERLRRSFGAAFDAYASKTPRWL